MFNREIFRKTAMDKLSSPDDLDELLQINSKFSWLFLVSMLCLVLGGAVWGIFGKIVNRVSMFGAIIQTNPSNTIYAAESGQVDTTYYLIGDKTTKVQPIANYISENQGNPRPILSTDS